MGPFDCSINFTANGHFWNYVNQCESRALAGPFIYHTIRLLTNYEVLSKYAVVSNTCYAIALIGLRFALALANNH